MKAKKTSRLESLRDNIMRQMSILLENQTRTDLFSETINTLVRQTQKDIIEHLNEITNSSESYAFPMQKIKNKYDSISKSLSFLFKERQRQWQNNHDYLINISKEFSQTIHYLSNTLIERDLFERQSNVLEQTALSHEKASNWRLFTQEILAKFHEFFPCHFFYLSFESDTGIQIYIYYLAQFSDGFKSKLKQNLHQKLQNQTHLTLIIEENELRNIEAPRDTTLESMQMIATIAPHSINSAGLISLCHASPYKSSIQEQDIIRSILSVMIMVIGSSKQLNSNLEKLEYFSGHDPLTGLYNRRFFDEILDYEIGRAQRHQHEFCVLMLDLDDFKKINDSYGHPTGDSTLIRIAETLHSNIRKGDIATRIGGDEFAILLPETSRFEAHALAERLRHALHHEGFTAENGMRYRVTTSIGLAHFPRDGKTAQELMNNTDIALYRAKHRGKNGISSIETGEQQVQLRHDYLVHPEKLH